MDVANFIMSKSSKVLNELIDKTWKMQTANEKLELEKKSRVNILDEKLADDCSPGCNKLWLKCFLEVLRKNEAHLFVYAAAMHDLLTKGCGKFKNLIQIIGAANVHVQAHRAHLQFLFKTCKRKVCIGRC